MTSLLDRLGRFYLAGIIVFALGPVLMIIVASFNAATSFPSPFEGFTLRWYWDLVNRPEFLQGMLVSGQVAIMAAALAAAVSFLAAYALSRIPFRGRYAVATALMGPLFVPEIVLSLATLQIASLIGIPLNLLTLTAAHSVFVLPFVFRLVLAGFSRFDFNIEDAARSLGANRPQALRLITLPLVRPALIAGFTLAVIMSFVNLPVSLFLTNPGTATLPVIVFAFMESRINPTIAAVATLVIVAATIATICIDRILRIRLFD